MKIKAVKTTGIYCRAECGARPNPENVRVMANPIAAMAAGFRPCLMCRPDRLPGLGLEPPHREVEDALRLVAQGFLDHHSTEALAERVGYSSRHLVRLFERHIGATPDFVARARRAHFARRLLDETDLTVTEIAFAAGFSSLRQMNRVIKDLFAFTPKQLREKRSRADLVQSIDGGLALTLPFSQPMDVESMMAFLQARAIPGIEVVEDGTYRRTVDGCGLPGVIEVQPDIAQSRLKLTLHLPTFGVILDLVERARNLFQLAADDRRAKQVLKRDDQLKPYVRRNPGLRLPGYWDRFETAVRIIVGQQVSVVAANTIMGRLIEQVASPVETALPKGLKFVFPGPQQIADASIGKLGIPNARVDTIQRFADAVASGQFDLYRSGDVTEVTRRLESIKGIGPWTSHMIAARVMHVADAFPAGDLGLRRGGAILQGQTGMIPVKDLEQMATRWQPYRAHAITYLWLSVIGDQWMPKAVREQRKKQVS